MSESNVVTQEKAKVQRTKSVDAITFAKHWQAAASVEDAIARIKEATGIEMTVSNANIKAASLRKPGKMPHLKTMPRKPRTRIDYDAVDAELAAAQKQVEQAQAEQEKVEAESNG